MLELPQTRLLPKFNFVLMHSKFLDTIATFKKDYGCNIGEINSGLSEKILLELEQLAKKTESIKNLQELKQLIKDEQFNNTRVQPRDYYNNGYIKADHLFYSIPIDVEENALAEMHFFYPAIFNEQNLTIELNCCSHNKYFTNPKDVRCIEVYEASYAPPKRFVF